MILHDSQAVAAMLGRSKYWVEIQARKGTIPSRRIGSSWRFTDEDIAAYLESARSTAATATRVTRRRRSA